MRDLYAELRRRERSEATQERAKQKLGHFPRLWGEDCRMADIDARKLGEYIDARLVEGVKRITIRDELAFLRQLLKLARRHGIFALHVEDVMPLQFEVGHTPKKTWCRERDFPRLLRQLAPARAAHLAWIVATGSRWGESLRALREDVDFATYRVLVRGSKTSGSWAHVALPTRLRKWVRYALTYADRERTSALFVDWPNAVRDMSAACVRAGIPRVGPHDLRRTFGKWLRLWGFDLETIAKLLRHTDPKLAREVYADVEGAELSAVVDQAEAQNRSYRSSTRKDET